MTDYDPSVIRQVRLLISDPSTDATNNPVPTIFTDTELTDFLDLEDGNLKRGAALAMERIADNEALILKSVVDHDVTIDGTKVAATLRAAAAALRQQAEDDLDRDGYAAVIPGRNEYGYFDPSGYGFYGYW